PSLASVILSCGLIAAAGSPAQRAALLPPLINGERFVAFAYGERQARYSPWNVETTAKRNGDGFALSGRKSVVLHGDSADTLLVSARTGGSSRDAAGIALFLVDRKAAGVAVRGAATIDGLHSAEVALANVRVGKDAVLGSID